MTLFQINPETKEAELTPEARTLEPFKSIIRRKSPMEGDADGRKKLLNEKEISFIYWSANYDSNLKYASDEERIELLKARLALPKEWKPDALVVDAIEFVIQQQKTLSTPIFESALNAGMALKAWYDEMATDIRTNPKQYKPEWMLKFQEGFVRLKSTLETIEEARQKVMSEAETRQTRKGRQIGRFELNDPDEE